MQQLAAGVVRYRVHFLHEGVADYLVRRLEADPAGSAAGGEFELQELAFGHVRAFGEQAFELVGAKERRGLAQLEF